MDPQDSVQSQPNAQSSEGVPQQPVQSGSNNFTKLLFFIVVGLLLFAGIAGVSYYLGARSALNIQNVVKTSQTTLTPSPTVTPTPDPTANWQTYTSPKKFSSESYTFKYPPTWLYQPSLQYTTPTYIEDRILLPGPGAPRPQITIDTISNLKNLNTAEFISQHQTSDQYPNLSLNHYAKDPSITIPGVDWVIDRNGGGASSYEGALLIKGDTAVLIDCGQCDDQLTNQILSTFKFTQ